MDGPSRVVAALLAVAAVGTACTTADDAVNPPPEERLATLAEYDLPYTSEQALDVYRPEDAGPWPTVVFLHGGEETKERWESYARDIAARGVVVLTPQWHATPAELDLAPLAALEDAACAMRFARGNAAQHGGSAERVTAAGFSLGGNLAAVLAMSDAAAFAGDCVVDADVTATADGFVGVDAVYDFAALQRDEVGGADVPPVYEAYDTFSLVDAASPTRAVILTGLSPLREDGERLRDALTEAGWDVTYVNLPLAHGGFTSTTNGSTDAIARVAHGQSLVQPDA